MPDVDRADEPDLLEVLDAMVRRDRASPFFSGSIAICVLSNNDSARWWQGDFGDGATTSFPDTIRLDRVDAMIALTPEAARFLLTGIQTGAKDSGMLFFGDQKLVRRFVDRYLDRTTGIGHQFMRVQTARGGRTAG